MQGLAEAIENLKDEKFRVASNFTVQEVSQPIAMKIISSVLFAYAKILTTRCPYKEVTSGHLISTYFSENFVPWFARSFPLLAHDSSVTSFLRNKTQGWFRTNLKRLQNRVKNA